jgi:Protein of unknown function (DUF4239)
MLSYVESAFAVALALAGAVFVVAVLNRVWPIKNRKLVNDVTGWQLGILGTTYGVILGFMLATVWEDFHTADVGVYLEASSLLSASRIAAGLPSPQRETMQGLALQYANAAVNQEWPAMQRQEANHSSEEVAGEMWQTLMTMKAAEDTESSTVRDHMTRTLSELTERRNLRAQEHAVRLPMMLWLLLITGAVATIGSACLLGNDNRWLHYCQVMALTFVVTVTLSAIADLARPFEGAAAVSSAPFQQAAEMMQHSVSH